MVHPDLVKGFIAAFHAEFDAESRTLMAYVDGKLETGDAREVEAFLETSEEARELVAKLQGSGDLLKETYAMVLSAPRVDQDTANE